VHAAHTIHRDPSIEGHAAAAGVDQNDTAFIDAQIRRFLSE